MKTPLKGIARAQNKTRPVEEASPGPFEMHQPLKGRPVDMSKYRKVGLGAKLWHPGDNIWLLGAKISAPELNYDSTIELVS